jgi:hypothetical protein
MAPSELGKALVAAYRHNGWRTGVMLWQFSSDPSSAIISQATQGLLQLLPSDSPGRPLVKFTCVNRIASQSSDQSLLSSLAVPLSPTVPGYNYVSFYSWTFRAGAQGSLLFWVNPGSFLSTVYRGAMNSSQLREAIKGKYGSQGVKVLANAFGSSELPTSAGLKAEEVAVNLALFVTAYGLDGVEVDYQDNPAFANGSAEQWLVAFTAKLRSLLPNLLIVHTVSAAYFVGAPVLPRGGYLSVNDQAGSLIDFYNLRYFNQYGTAYSSAQSLFQQSTGWAAKTALR